MPWSKSRRPKQSSAANTLWVNACELLKLRNHRWRALLGMADTIPEALVGSDGTSRDFDADSARRTGARSTRGPPSSSPAWYRSAQPQRCPRRAFSYPVACRPGGVVPGTSGASGRCRCGSRRTVQTDPVHRRCLLEARSAPVPADVSQTDSLEGRALDDDTEPGFQLGREVEELGLPLAGSSACAADHVAPPAPPILWGKDLHDRRLLGHVDGAALPCLGGDRPVVCVDDGGVAQSLHQSEQWSVATGAVLPPSLQLDDHQTSLVRCAKQIHLAETGVRSRSPQRKLVVEQAHSVTADPRPSRLEAPERDRQMLLRGIAGILRLRTSIVSDEVALALGGTARSLPPQLVVLPAQGGNVDRLDRICQTSSRMARTEQNRELSREEIGHSISLAVSDSESVHLCTNHLAPQFHDTTTPLARRAVGECLRNAGVEGSHALRSGGLCWGTTRKHRSVLTPSAFLSYM